MTGYIKNIRESVNGKEFGFIVGEDRNEYYFDDRFLIEKQTMTGCDINDVVEFVPGELGSDGRHPYAKEVSLVKNKEKNIIKFFSAGFSRNLQIKYAYEQYLKPDSGEDIVITKISKILYISRLGQHSINQRSQYQFCVAGATEVLKQYIRGKYEFLIVMSHFDSGDWQQKNLIVDREIRKRREIADRRLLVNFYVLSVMQLT